LENSSHVQNINSNEKDTAEAFNRQSSVFDNIYSSNLIVQYKRDRVRSAVEKYLPPHSSILELNAGTGEDAVYFASKGHKVHATDIATEMQNALRKKAVDYGLNEMITTEVCSFNHLASLKNTGPYDLIFSNFAGLNCTGELQKVLEFFPTLLKPRGLVTLVIMPRFCLWEFLLLFKGNFKTAFRRFKSKDGVKAHIEGVHFKCWYYSPSFIKRCLEQEFELLSCEGLCTIVPPSYFENFPVKHPSLFLFLKKVESVLKKTFPWKGIGDYFIITLRKRK